MRPIVYAFVFAVVFLIFKAFFLDEYIAKHYGDDANTTAEVNVSAEATVAPAQPQTVTQPKVTAPKENILSDVTPEKQEENQKTEDKKMPLDKLGDSLSKHIKL